MSFISPDINFNLFLRCPTKILLCSTNMVQSWSDFNTQIYFFVVYPLQSIKNGIEKLSEKGNGFARKIISSYIYNLLKLL